MSTIVLQLPNSYVEVERDEMEYVDGGIYVSNSGLYGILGAAVMTGSLSYIAATLGYVEAALSVFCPPVAIGLAIGGAWFFADLPQAIRDAAIQGKGIDFGVKYTSFGAPYQLDCDVR